MAIVCMNDLRPDMSQNLGSAYMSTCCVFQLFSSQVLSNVSSTFANLKPMRIFQFRSVDTASLKPMSATCNQAC